MKFNSFKIQALNCAISRIACFRVPIYQILNKKVSVKTIIFNICILFLRIFGI